MTVAFQDGTRSSALPRLQVIEKTRAPRPAGRGAGSGRSAVICPLSGYTSVTAREIPGRTDTEEIAMANQTFKMEKLVGESPDGIEAAALVALATSAEKVHGQTWTTIGQCSTTSEPLAPKWPPGARS